MDFKDMTVGEFARRVGAGAPVCRRRQAPALSGAALVSMVSRKCGGSNNKYTNVKHRFQEVDQRNAQYYEVTAG